MKAILLLFILLLSCFVAAQNNNPATKDSLRQRIAVSRDEEKLEAYNQLHTLLFLQVSDRPSLNEYLALSEEYQREAQKQDHIKQQSDAQVTDIIACIRCNEFDEARKRAPETLILLKSVENTEGIYVVYKQLILAYCRSGEYGKALSELQQMYEQAKAKNDTEGQFHFTYYTGIVYMHQDRLVEAEDYYRKSIIIAKELKKKPFDLINVHSELCNMLQATERFDDFFPMMKACENLLREIEKENVATNRNYQANWDNLWTLYAYAYNAKGDFDKAEYYCDLLEKNAKSKVLLANITNIRASIFDAHGEYEKALQQIDKAIELDPFYIHTHYRKVEILSHMEKAPRTWAEVEKTVLLSDSIRNDTFNSQLDELRTQYEVDKHIAEKERNRNYFLFALAGCALLISVLGIWIYYNRKIEKKNRTLAQQIKELTAQQELRYAELLNRTAIAQEEEAGDNGLCPESRMDKLCNAIRNLILRDKAYRNPNITRDYMIECLGTNRELFVEAFMHCFGMPFPDYINSLRLKDAIILLQQSDLSIDAISEKTGFGTVRTFQRRFQAKYNLSPKDYRKIAQNKEQT